VKLITHLDDYTPGMKCVVISAYEDYHTQVGETVRRERIDLRGAVCTFEVWNPPIMILHPIRSVSSGGMPGALHRMGPFAMLCASDSDAPQSQDAEALILHQDDVALAFPTDEYLAAYQKHFCKGKKGTDKEGKSSVRGLLKEE